MSQPRAKSRASRPIICVFHILGRLALDLAGACRDQIPKRNSHMPFQCPSKPTLLRFTEDVSFCNMGPCGHADMQESEVFSNTIRPRPRTLKQKT